MRNRVRTIQAACILGLGVLSGCASLLPLSPLAPVLLADPADVTLIEALAHEQYTRVESCDARKSCPQDHYTRGLIALFQSRERAVASFQQVRSEAPNSRFAALALQMFVPRDPEPLLIDRATVIWVKGSEFGVDFDTPQPTVAERITTIISRLVKTQHGSLRKG